MANDLKRKYEAMFLVDSAEATAAEVRGLLQSSDMLSPSLAGARCEIYVSDMHLNLRIQAERFLGFEIPRIRVVDSEFEEVELQGI